MWKKYLLFYDSIHRNFFWLWFVLHMAMRDCQSPNLVPLYQLGETGHELKLCSDTCE